jgi:hypothetical protein
MDLRPIVKIYCSGKEIKMIWSGRRCIWPDPWEDSWSDYGPVVPVRKEGSDSGHQ